MADAEIVLKFEIAEGLTPDAECIAKAILAWIELLKVAAAVVAPGAHLKVGLAGVEDGSDIFKLTLEKLEGFGEHLKAGAGEFPLVTKAVLALAGLIGTTVIGVIATDALTPDPRIPADQMEVFEEHNRLLSQSVELQREQNRFFGILHEEPAIERFDVIRGHDGETVFSIPRGDFAARSGLWTGDSDPAVTRSYETRTATWEVVLIKPVLVPEPRRWMFAKDGIEFSARMDDREFLEALHDNTLPIRVAEGIRMKLEVKYREEYDGESWLPVRYSHRVSRVLDPLPPPSPTPLFANTRAP